MEVPLSYNLDLHPQSVWHTVSATAASKASLLFLQEAGDFFCGPDYYTTREGYSSFLIKYTLRGCGELFYQNQQYAVPEGHFFWVDCQKWQSYRTHPDIGDWHTVWIHFYGGNAPFYYDLFCKQNGGSPVASLPDNSPVPNLICGLLSLNDSADNPQIRDLKAADLLGQLITQCTLNTMHGSTTGEIPQTIQDVRTYLEEHYPERLSLDHLGQQFNLNPFYLQKQFKRYIGQSPNEYLIYTRMTKAKALLRQTDKSISQIAGMVGVDNLGHFTRQFKKLEGITPHEYRKLWPTIYPENTL